MLNSDVVTRVPTPVTHHVNGNGVHKPLSAANGAPILVKPVSSSGRKASVLQVEVVMPPVRKSPDAAVGQKRKKFDT